MSNLMEFSFVSIITMEGTCSFTPTHVFFLRRNQKYKLFHTCNVFLYD